MNWGRIRVVAWNQGVSIGAGVPCQNEHPKSGDAFGIGRSGDTSPGSGAARLLEVPAAGTF